MMKDQYATLLEAAKAGHKARSPFNHDYKTAIIAQGNIEGYHYEIVEVTKTHRVITVYPKA